MNRILLLLILFYLCYWIAKRWVKVSSDHARNKMGSTTENQNIVKCARCDTYVLESDCDLIKVEEVTTYICKNQPCKK
jgi:hypothetical protein